MQKPQLLTLKSAIIINIQKFTGKNSIFVGQKKSCNE